jgi:hypothetical protein
LVDIVRALEITKETLLLAYFAVVQCVLRAQHDGHVKNLERALEHGRVAAAVPRKQPRNVVEQIRIFAFSGFHAVDELLKLLKYKLVVRLPGHQEENVDPETFDVAVVVVEHFLDRIKALVPLVVDHVDFGLFNHAGCEVREEDRSL